MQVEAETKPMRASGRRVRRDALAVAVRWGEQRLFSQVLSAEGTRECLLGPSGTEGVSRVALAWEPSGPRLVFRDGVHGEVLRNGETMLSLSDLVRDGLAEEKDGAWELSLGHRDELFLTLGHLTVEAVPAVVPPQVTAREELDYRFLNVLMVTLLVAALAVVTAVVDTGSGAIDDELTATDGARYRRVLMAPPPKPVPMLATKVERTVDKPQRRQAEAGRPRPPDTKPSQGGGRPDARAQAREAIAGLGMGRLLAGGGLGDELKRAMGRMVGANDNGLGGWTAHGNGMGGDVGGPVGIGRIGQLHDGKPGEPRLTKGAAPGPVIEPGPVFTCDSAAHACLDKETIRRVIRGHVGELRYCYERLLNRSPTLGGKVTVRFMVASSGAVARSEVVDSTAGSPELADCVASRVLTWHFPVPAHSPGYVVSYPFLFKTSGD